jgi:hydroxymethylbilane synthase
LTLRIATRGSALARAQTEWIAERLRALQPGLQVETLIITTQGDRTLDRPLTEFGGKGVFVRELEEALLDGRADAAVHSLKDLPADVPEGLVLAAFPEREDPRDALALPHGAALDEADPLPPGARVGNSSLRRKAQLLHTHPDLRVEPIRGNVDTRLRKLDAGEFDALVLAAAGLRRLGLQERISLLYAPEEFVPAPGQGALAVECRADSPWRALLEQLDHPDTRACVQAERDVMARLGGGCLAPVGVYGSIRGELLQLTAMVASPDGRQHVREHAFSPPNLAAELAEGLAGRVLDAGGKEILAAIRQSP